MKNVMKLTAVVFVLFAGLSSPVGARGLRSLEVASHLFFQSDVSLLPHPVEAGPTV
jgi:hypothetical protein